jgi:hypothetical protein
MGLGFEPSVILGIGFIQIESVKSVVKKSGVGFGCGCRGRMHPGSDLLTPPGWRAQGVKND